MVSRVLGRRFAPNLRPRLALASILIIQFGAMTAADAQIISFHSSTPAQLSQSEAEPLSGPVRVWQTTTSGTKLAKAMSQEPELHFGALSGTSDIIDVHPTTTLQVMDGFGAAMTDSAASLIFHSPKRDEIMAQLFSPSGAHLSFVRLPMGASDLATRNYSYDDMPPGGSDPNLVNFSIAHDTAYIIPLLQQARSLNPGLKILATPWSAPGWMKIGGTFTGKCSGSDNYLKNSLYPTYAQYFVKYIQAYRSYGLPIHMVSMQNEPRHCSPEYATMNMEPIDQARFAVELRSALNRASLAAVKILAWDHNWFEGGSATSYPQAVLSANQGQARAAVSAIGYHCYLSPDGGYTVQSNFHARYPATELHFTECTGTTAFSNSAQNLVWEMRNNLIGPIRYCAVPRATGVLPSTRPLAHTSADARIVVAC